MPPTYYRGCWHVVSRGFLFRYRHPLLRGLSSLLIELYIPKYFFTHAASLHQSFLHCAISPTAASRRSLGRVSVPMCPYTLSGRILIVALVGRYLTNWLIRRGSISDHRGFSCWMMPSCRLMRYYQPFPAAIPRSEAGSPRVTHPSATMYNKNRPKPFQRYTPFDLHVLGTPPAFILSQDRTLMFKCSFQSSINLTLSVLRYYLSILPPDESLSFLEITLAL